MLQETFEKFIIEYKKLNEDQVEFLRQNGWGMAGKPEGNKIIATKIPKEFHKYFHSSDPQEKKYYYCHCSRVRELFKMEDRELDADYCWFLSGYLGIYSAERSEGRDTAVTAEGR